MELNLTGKRALITGGSKGIGLATARTLAKEGCTVVLAARDAQELEGAAATLRADGSPPPVLCPVDLATQEGVKDAARVAGELDILVNNAGAIPPGNLAALDPQTWRKGWELKVHGYMDLSRLVYPTLAERKGVIVNIIGSAGETLPADYLAGATGNAALMAFTRSLGRVSPRDGVRVVAVNPGPVGTDRLIMLMKARAEQELQDAGRWRELIAAMPFGRFAEPQEIADAVAFLASPRAAYISGTVLTIDGGGGY